MPFVSIMIELIDKSLHDSFSFIFWPSEVNSLSLANRSALVFFSFSMTTANPPAPAPHSERPSNNESRKEEEEVQIFFGWIRDFDDLGETGSMKIWLNQWS